MTKNIFNPSYYYKRLRANLSSYSTPKPCFQLGIRAHDQWA